MDITWLPRSGATPHEGFAQGAFGKVAKLAADLLIRPPLPVGSFMGRFNRYAKHWACRKAKLRIVLVRRNPEIPSFRENPNFPLTLTGQFWHIFYEAASGGYFPKLRMGKALFSHEIATGIKGKKLSKPPRTVIGCVGFVISERFSISERKMNKTSRRKRNS